MKQGGVAKSYLDPLAVRVQSVRWGKGRGYRRFLVFAELTKSRKGADYVALFAYFSFEAAIRIIFAEGPRVVINGITLYSVTKLNLIPTGEHAAPEGQSPVAQFFVNIGAMADKDKLQATILFGMLWTCFIWILAAISLAVSVILYLLFLWHHIPSEAGGLKNYCRIKINKRMERVVRTKVDTALKKENQIRQREDAKLAQSGIKKQPTLPDIAKAGDPTMPPLSRATTLTTLPEYTSRPGTARGSTDSFDRPPMPALPPNGRPGPQRIMTHQSDASIASFSSNAPLVASASDIGYADNSPVPTPGPFGRPGPPNRGMTPNPRMNGPPRPGTAQGGAYPMEPLGRPGTAMSNGPRRTSDESMGGYGPDRGMGARTPSWDRPNDMPGRRPPPNDSYFPPILEGGSGRNSPAMGRPPNGFPPSQPPSRGPPERSFTPLNGGPPPMGPNRSFTPLNGGPPRGPPERSYTPVGGPPLARVQTAEDFGGGYRAFTPEPAPMYPDQGYAPNGYGADRYRPGPPNGRGPPPSGGPGYPPDRMPPRRQSSEVRDILDSY